MFLTPIDGGANTMTLEQWRAAVCDILFPAAAGGGVPSERLSLTRVAALA